jgi:hypothetical protein
MIVWYSVDMAKDKETKVKIVEEKKPYRSPVAINTYGEEFERYHRLGEYKDLLPSFKDWYYQKKTENEKESLTNIMRSFNSEVCAPIGRKFHPHLEVVRGWRRSWDLDLMQKANNLDYELGMERDIKKVVQSTDDNDLEHGIKTLGSELLNDAMQMLKDDQQLEETYESDELMKRRSYIINVFSHATKLVHGKAALMLKASAEKRDTAGFLMTLISRATAGKISDEQIDVLKSAYAPKENGIST